MKKTSNDSATDFKGRPIVLEDKIIIPVYKCATTSISRMYPGRRIQFESLPQFKKEKIALVRNPFDRLVSVFAYRGLKDIGELLLSLNDWHVKPQSDYLKLDGIFQPDKVFKMENIQEFINYLPKTKEVFLNKTPHKDYREYFSDSERILAEDIFKEDLERFGYEF